jgi:hypothetical protein
LQFSIDRWQLMGNPEVNPANFLRSLVIGKFPNSAGLAG